MRFVVSWLAADDNALIIAEKGGIDLLLDIFRQHSANPDVIKEACDALWNIAATGVITLTAVCCLMGGTARNRISVSQKGGIDILLNVFRYHSADASVMEHACVALWNMSANGTVILAVFVVLWLTSVHNRIAIVQKGGIDVLLNVFGQHSANAGVMKEACYALANMTLNGVIAFCAFFTATADNRVAVAHKGGIDLLLNVFRQHSANAGVMKEACFALWNIAANGVIAVWVLFC